MKKLFLLLTLISMDNLLSAQNSQQQKIDSVCQIVKQYFNEKNATKIYELTGEAFQKQLTPEAFKNIADNNLFPLGEMKSTEFENHADGISKYKAAFASMNLALFISLDKNDKIETFLFKPYTDEAARKNYKAPTTNPLITSLDKEVDSAVQPYISLQATVGLGYRDIKRRENHFLWLWRNARGNKQIPDEHTNI